MAENYYEELKNAINELRASNEERDSRDASFRRKLLDQLYNLDDDNMPTIVRKISNNGQNIASLVTSVDFISATVIEINGDISTLDASLATAQSNIAVNANNISLQSAKINTVGLVGGQYSPTAIYSDMIEASRRVRRGALWCCGYSHNETLDGYANFYTVGRIYVFSSTGGWSYTGNSADYIQGSAPSEPSDGKLWTCTGAITGYTEYDTYRYNGTAQTWERCSGYATSEQLAEIKTFVDDNASTISQIVSYSDGTYTANASFILQAINNAPSTAMISADKIEMTGTTTFVKPDDLGAFGTTVIDGGRISTNTLHVDKFASTFANYGGTDYNVVEFGSGIKFTSLDDFYSRAVLGSTMIGIDALVFNSGLIQSYNAGAIYGTGEVTEGGGVKRGLMIQAAGIDGVIVESLYNEISNVRYRLVVGNAGIKAQKLNGAGTVLNEVTLLS